jgi:hypothetical protein
MGVFLSATAIGDSKLHGIPFSWLALYGSLFGQDMSAKASGKQITLTFSIGFSISNVVLISPLHS